MMLTVAVVIYLAANIPTVGLSVVQSALQAAQQRDPNAADVGAFQRSFAQGSGCFSLIYSLVVLLPLSFGVVWMAVRAARGQALQISDILRGFRRFPTVLGTVILIYLMMAIPLLLALAVGGAIAFWGVGFEAIRDGIHTSDFDDCSTAAIAVGAAWAFTCVIVMYWIAIRTSLAMFVVVDEAIGSRGPLQSIELSWRITRGRALSLLGLFITIGLMMIATVLCCFLPFIFLGYPLALVMVGLAYNMLLAREFPANQSAAPSAT